MAKIKNKSKQLENEIEMFIIKRLETGWVMGTNDLVVWIIWLTVEIGILVKVEVVELVSVGVVVEVFEDVAEVVVVAAVLLVVVVVVVE